MATLTAAQITKFRRQIGDIENPQVLSSDEIQTAYDDASDDEALTMVYLLRQMIGATAHRVDTMGVDGTGKRAKQYHDNLRKMLEYWEEKAGVSGGLLQVGYYDTRLDFDDEDFEDGTE